jgi:hypothetical protein
MKRLILQILALLILAVQTMAAEVSVAWDANIEADLAGYKVFWDTVNPPVANVFDIGNVTTYNITGLPDGQIVFIGVKAYDADANESGMSDILQYIPRTSRLIIIIDAPQGPTIQ